MTATEYVILVNDKNQPVGQEEKISAHQKSLLHRAFSVFIFRENDGPELLLQQRAFGKYHSQGLWTNSCCSHPRLGESIIDAGERRLYEEMGLTATLKDCGWFHYQAELDNGLSENEIDHVLIGYVPYNTVVNPNTAEVHSYRWISLAELEVELASSIDQFTFWFTQAFKIAKESI